MLKRKCFVNAQNKVASVSRLRKQQHFLRCFSKLSVISLACEWHMHKSLCTMLWMDDTCAKRSVPSWCLVSNVCIRFSCWHLCFTCSVSYRGGWAGSPLFTCVVHENLPAPHPSFFHSTPWMQWWNATYAKLWNKKEYINVRDIVMNF